MTVCANCETTQGPFERKRIGYPLCLEKNLGDCAKRRNKLMETRWGKDKELVQ